MLKDLLISCSDKWLLIAAFSAAAMAYAGSKQYKLLGNGEVRRCFKNRFYEILSILLTAINWPLFAVYNSKAMVALQESGLSDAVLFSEESKSLGTVAIAIFLFPVFFFAVGKVASLAKLGYFYDWDEPAEDIAEQEEIAPDQSK